MSGPAGRSPTRAPGSQRSKSLCCAAPTGCVTFSRAFRRATGRTFASYVNGVRVGAACRLLIESELPIAAVAAESGSRSLANFNRRFRELRATTPRAYRGAFTQAGPGGFQPARKQESRPGIPERTAA